MRPTFATDALALAGVRVLVVEDDYLILMELEWVLREAGAEIAGMCRTVREALALAEETEPAAAILDVRLGRESIEPVAHRLAARGTPFIFYTGETAAHPVLARWTGCKVVTKPAASGAILAALSERLRAAGAAPG
jgi:DNA-binding response OmpR family regulator